MPPPGTRRLIGVVCSTSNALGVLMDLGLGAEWGDFNDSGAACVSVGVVGVVGVVGGGWSGDGGMWGGDGWSGNGGRRGGDHLM